MLTQLAVSGRFAPKNLFRPERVAVLGAAGAQGLAVMHSLLAGGFQGAVLPVALEPALLGVLTYPTVEALPETPDLALVCSGIDPAEAFPMLAARGCFAAIVMADPADAMTAGPGPLRALAEQTGVRSLGPSSFGLAVPGIGLDATMGHAPIRVGRAALVSQSAALCRTVLDWAEPNGVGFSHVVGVGDNDDIGFGLVLDWLARDSGTGAILLDIRQLKDARAFLSAARGAARLRPVVALQSGGRRRDPSGMRDAAFRAALGRAGVLCVDTLDDLLGAAETLARAKPAQGDSVAIVANALGPADLAADAVLRAGLRLAAADIPLAPARTMAEAALRAGVGHGVGGVLVVLAPETWEPPNELVAELTAVAHDARPPVVVCVMGADTGASLRRRLAQAGVPGFVRPDAAVRALLHLVEDRRNRAAARELPSAAVLAVKPDRAAVVRTLAMADGELGEAAMPVLAAYGITGADPALPANVATVRIGLDPLWGPIVAVGPAGSERWDDCALDLPPLNLSLAHATLRRLPWTERLGAAAIEALADTLVRMSALLVDFPRVVAGRFDPGAPQGARLRIVPEAAAARLALPPYPAELVTTWTDRRGRAVTIRPIRPEDADGHAALFDRLTPEDVRYRFFSTLKELSAEQIARMTNIDYDREMAFVAVRDDQTVGVARLVRDAFGPEGEFAILVQPDAKGAGLAGELMARLFAWARAERIGAVVGQVLVENRPMLAFVRHLGFVVRRLPDETEFVEVRKELA